MTGHPVSPDDQSVVSLLTPSGRGAVATIYYRGNFNKIDQMFTAANGKSLPEQHINQVLFGHWGTEDVVVCLTSPNELEIHCHAGVSAVTRILNELEGMGCKKLPWEELRKQTLTPFESELEIAISKAYTLKTAALLQRQQKLFPETIQNIIGFIHQKKTSEISSILEELEAITSQDKLGQHLVNPWRIVLAGRPNVGKSSLMNALMGYERSIVFDQPGTTRDVVHATTAFDGWTVELSDTAGIREKIASEIEQMGISLAEEKLKTADCRLVLVDRSVLPTAEDFQLIEQWPDSILVANKCDLPDAWGDQLQKDAISVSSITKEGLPILIEKIVREMGVDEVDDSVAIPFTQRQNKLLKQAIYELQNSEFENALTCLNQLIQ
jgi:tRNA modification GTPase